MKQAAVYGTKSKVPVKTNDDGTLTFDLGNISYAGPIKVISLSYNEKVEMEAEKSEEENGKH